MTMNKEDRKLRDKIIQRGRREITEKLKKGTYIEMMKEEYGIMDEKELVLDKEFLDDMIREIEESRKRKIEERLKEEESDIDRLNHIVEKMVDVIRGDKYKIIRRVDRLENCSAGC